MDECLPAQQNSTQAALPWRRGT